MLNGKEGVVGGGLITLQQLIVSIYDHCIFFIYF